MRAAFTPIDLFLRGRSHLLSRNSLKGRWAFSSGVSLSHSSASRRVSSQILRSVLSSTSRLYKSYNIATTHRFLSGRANLLRTKTSKSCLLFSSRLSLSHSRNISSVVFFSALSSTSRLYKSYNIATPSTVITVVAVMIITNGENPLPIARTVSMALSVVLPAISW